ncbi:RNA 2',3'-cyclic phosphodiesterase [Candidatus Daviesbacteria bacterium]|nr:RNA 2',3'-cyclic phosphodiesterase [Candidatus Daviesbacteria bacterium]
MRFFIALEIPSDKRAQFQAIQTSLHTLIPQTRLTDLNKVHLTLAFIGEQSDLFINQLINIIKTASFQIPPFEVAPAYIDGFPTIHNPSVLWVGVKGDVGKLFLMHERIKDGLKALKLPADERRFVPHISIAKLNSHFQINTDLERDLEEIMVKNFEPIQISSIKLFESVPSEGFHKHNTLAEIRLI